MLVTDSGTYRAYAHIVTPSGERVPVLTLRRPTETETRVLYVLCEHVGRILDVDEVCDRIEMSRNSVNIILTRLRQILHRDWVIENGNATRRGIRIVYAQHPLNNLPKTRLESAPRRRSKAAIRQQEYKERWARERAEAESELAGV